MGYTCAMPFEGIWTLRCQGCKEDFTVELNPGDQLVDFAKSSTCPHCKKAPADDAPSSKALDTWHQVIGFQSTPK